MNRKIRIASALALAGLLSAMTPLAAHAGSPLLSGYGAPGAGEQAIVGSTLLGGPRGGAGSSGSSGSGSTGVGGGSIGSSSGSEEAGGSARSGDAVRTGGAAASGSGADAASPKTRSSRQAGRLEDSQTGRQPAYVHPNVPASAQGDSSVIWISGSDVLPLLAIVALLAIVGALTVHLSRLQPRS